MPILDANGHNYYHGSSHCLAPAGIPCVHACAVLSRVNKQPENFCHRWLTMDSYKETYNHHINPIPGQPLWEKAEDCNRPHAPKIKTKPEKLKMKRRMDADEKSAFGTKKPKVDPKLSGNTADGVHLKRQLSAFTCSYCAVAAAAAEAAEKKKNDEVHTVPEKPVQQPQDVSGQADLGSNPQEIELTQPSASEQEDSGKDPAPKRPSKLSPRRRSSNQPTTPTVNPLQGASSATSSKFANLMQFIPTPGFRPPRKKN
ncbi:hypothetical protein Ahy_A08g038889 [Arachis hypogaea]|uniref:SWIM-type domain-containing protein n=1 Tax=Arachis hypogaea TaxID=3818 RepID=A0A445BUN0_ARAHY|nr:hypothetical protein Ahy_A08g038889 [Arachis hypogaea]